MNCIILMVGLGLCLDLILASLFHYCIFYDSLRKNPFEIVPVIPVRSGWWECMLGSKPIREKSYCFNMVSQNVVEKIHISDFLSQRAVKYFIYDGLTS